jgi:hypothetical protein
MITILIHTFPFRKTPCMLITQDFDIWEICHYRIINSDRVLRPETSFALFYFCNLPHHLYQLCGV